MIDTKLKFFLGGASGIRPPLVPKVASFIKYRLLSTHRSFKGNTKTWAAVSHHPESAMEEIMCDSGAFTSWSKGHNVTLDEVTAAYDECIRIISPKIKLWFINLDVIPGEAGKAAETSAAQRKAAMDESDRNYAILRKRYGPRILPVFHQTETNSRLYECIDMSDGYVGLGFRQDFAEEDRMVHARKTIEKSKLHRPGVMLHGLATTGFKMMKSTLFDSVDSASWLYNAAMGGVLILEESGELADINVSQESPARAIPRGHYNNKTSDEQAHIRERIALCGSTLKEVQEDLSHRIVVNAHEMVAWLDSRPPANMIVEPGLFDET